MAVTMDIGAATAATTRNAEIILEETLILVNALATDGMVVTAVEDAHTRVLILTLIHHLLAVLARQSGDTVRVLTLHIIGERNLPLPLRVIANEGDLVLHQAPLHLHLRRKAIVREIVPVTESTNTSIDAAVIAAKERRKSELRKTRYSLETLNIPYSC